MTTPADWIKVELTPAEVSRAGEIGRLRNDRDSARGYRVRGFGSAETHTLGCLGELAVARYEGSSEQLTTTWEADKRRGYDIAGWQVRTRSTARSGLNLHKGDHGRFLLALGHAQPVIFLAGWLQARDAFPLGTRRESGKGDRVWWEIDKQHLRALPEKNGYGRKTTDWLVDPASPFWHDECGSMHPIGEHRNCRTLRPAENPARQQLTTEHMRQVVSTDPSAYLRDRTT